MVQQVHLKNSQRRAHQPVFCEERGGPCCPGWQNSAAPQTANAANPFVLSSEINSSAVNATHKYRHYVENFLLKRKRTSNKVHLRTFYQCWKSGSGSAGSACFWGLSHLNLAPLVRGTDPDPAPDPSLFS
jgi:hypothetical protein